MFDWSFYEPNESRRNERPAWVPKRTIYLTRHGSHAYGTSRPTSDLDIRGVCVSPKDHYLGFRRSGPHAFEQIVMKEPNDLVVFEIRKFLTLCVDANPNALELLFTDPSDHLLVTPAGEELLAHRDLFVTKLAKHSFAGYAAGQIAKMKLHYEWNNDKAPDHRPTREEFGLMTPPEIPKTQVDAALALVQKKLDEWNLKGLSDLPPPLRLALQNVMAELLAETRVSVGDLWKGAARTLAFDENFIEVVGREKRYRAAVEHWNAYQKHLQDRNPDRAAIEARFKYDTKYAMHLVRLLRMAREILTMGQILVRRPDALELLAIRDGAWTYEQVIAFAESEFAALTELMKTSKLPEEPDWSRLDALCIRLVELSLVA